MYVSNDKYLQSSRAPSVLQVHLNRTCLPRTREMRRPTQPNFPPNNLLSLDSAGSTCRTAVHLPRAWLSGMHPGEVTITRPRLISQRWPGRFFIRPGCVSGLTRCRHNSFCPGGGRFYEETTKHNIDIAGASARARFARRRWYRSSDTAAVGPERRGTSTVPFVLAAHSACPYDPWKLGRRRGGPPFVPLPHVSRPQRELDPFSVGAPKAPDNASMRRGRATVRSDAVRISAIARSPPPRFSFVTFFSSLLSLSFSFSSSLYDSSPLLHSIFRVAFFFLRALVPRFVTSLSRNAVSGYETGSAILGCFSLTLRCFDTLRFLCWVYWRFSLNFPL